jgi:DNA-binding NtrC family response regulator
MSDTSNTTSPADPSDRLAPAPAASRVLACVLCQSADEPHRVGQAAAADPRGKRPIAIGRLGDSFFELRPGVRVDCGRLLGDGLSREQLQIEAEGDGARIHNVGSTTVLIDPSPWPDPSRCLPQHYSAFVRLPAVIEIVGHSVLLLTSRATQMPAPHPLLLPLHPYGEADAMRMVGEGERIWHLRAAIARAAERGLPVLITGETGAGKELIARGLHALSRYARGPFFAINCTELRGELAALRLFGGRKGWPNPRTPETIGFFEAAGNGALFLDELGEIDESLQALLLRAPEHGFTRVGETSPRPVRCLLLAATNRGEAGVKHDVNYRFPVVISAPSLAQRREDLARIAIHLLREQAPSLVKQHESGRFYVRMDTSLMAGLLRHPLDGNVRAMTRILESSLAQMGDDALLRWPSDLPVPAAEPLVLRKEERHHSIAEVVEGIGRKATEPPPPYVAPPPASDDPREGFGQRPDPGRELLLETLHRTSWNKTETARILGIRRQRVYDLMEKYGIERPR